MAQWFFPTGFRCDLHQVDGGTFPFPRYCKHCLEEQLWLAFDEASAPLGLGIGEHAVQFRKAIRLAIFYYNFGVLRGKSKRAVYKDPHMHHLETDGVDLVDTLHDILRRLPREER